jgi:hypothetical protein
MANSCLLRLAASLRKTIRVNLRYDSCPGYT